MALPTEQLSLQDANVIEDIVAFVLKHNTNMDELERYINAMRDFISTAISTDTQGTTIEQVNTLISNSKQEYLLPVVWSTSVLPLDITNTELGTMVRVNNPDGSVTITMTNTKGTQKVFVQCMSFQGDIEYPQINVTDSFIKIHFDTRAELDQTTGHADTNTDPNIKRILIF